MPYVNRLLFLRRATHIFHWLGGNTPLPLILLIIVLLTMFLAGAGLATGEARRTEIPAQPAFDSQAKPESLASADFNGDGAADLIEGYSQANGAGLVKVRLAQPQSEIQFSEQAQVFSLPVAADWLGAGDFNADGHADLVLGARNGNKLIWLVVTGAAVSPLRVKAVCRVD